MPALRLTAKVAILWILGILIFGGIVLPPKASALHDQGYICYRCHSLNPADIRSGSNSIRLDQTVLATIPISPSGQTTWAGGMPITCDFCHRATDDVPMANFATKTYHHPVRTIADNGAVPNEIACGDCHWGDSNGNGMRDLTPESMTTKSATDGYPDHDNVTSGYTPHTLSNNPPHLTVPYWSSLSLPGATRANDTAFWTNVRGGTQDIVCWVCHEGGGRTNAPTRGPMTNRISTMLVKGDYTGSGNAKGHQIRTNAGGSQLGVGAALPCYDCHDSHGSVNHGFVLDNQSIYGANTSQVAETLYNDASRPYNDRRVCSQCHDTGNTQTLTTKAGGDARPVEGLYPMDPFNSSSTIHSASAGFADNMRLGTKNCLAKNSGCHATPHNPIGESAGGQNCAVCHSAIYEGMNAGTSTGYHHVMLADNAVAPGSYPTNPQPTTTAQQRTCLICHVDHNYFSKLVDPGHLRAQNLRRDIAVQPDNLTNAPLQIDYDNSLAPGGICTSCHQYTQTKNQPGINIKDDGSTSTPLVSKAFYGGSAHNYASSAPYVQSHFSSDNTDAGSYYRSNCTKCHNDPLAQDFQDNTTGYQFGLHGSDGTNAVNKLLAPLGYTPLTDNLSETFCYRCHSHSTDAIGGTRRKTADGSDWYNNRAMTQAAENIWGDFQKASRHPVAVADQKAGTAVVECASCHNVHLTRSATGSIVAYPDNTYAFDNYVLTDNTQTGKQNRSRFCLRCHDGSPPSYAVSASSYVPLTVRLDNASMNKWTWGGLPDNSSNRGHWNVSGQLQGTTIQACDACHDKHGSTNPKLIEATIAGQAVTGNNNTVCQACHTATGLGYNVTTATYEGYRETGTGYFSPTPVPGVTTTVRWPGYAVWDNTSLVGGAPVSPHRQTSKTGPAALGGLAVSDCKGCHDPHGTAYRYNMLNDNMTSTSFRLCFDCHGLTGSPAGTDNIARHYPTGVQGLSSDLPSGTNVGHNIKSTGSTYLAQYAALPCYDCHMTHGSLKGNTQLKSDERWSGLGNTKYGSTPSDNAADGASRTFCLGCHVASDDGAAKPDTVEGLSRQSGRLKLPGSAAADNLFEHETASSQGCQRCHYGTTYLDNTFGPHYPGTGLCDTCHESQGTRSSASATFNGAHRTHTDNVLYKFACKQCHSWTATVSQAVHKNDNAATQHAEVRFDNQATSGWGLIGYGTATRYEYRSLYASPYGATDNAPTYTPAGSDNSTNDGRQASVRWTNGTCANVWCHSNANPVTTVQGALGVSYRYSNPTWLDNSLGATCTGCHGGDATSGRRIGDNTSPANGSIAHLKHINGGAGCFKCHYFTVTTANNRQIDNMASHVNGTKDVVFAPSVGGVWNNSAKTCSGTSCHGSTPPLAEWDNLATVTGCAVCHQSQGPGNTFTFTGPHQAHTDNATYRTACEACHANFASGAGPNAVHADGDNSVGNPRTVQVAFTDCAASQTYNSRVYYSANVKYDPFVGGATSPAYTENAVFVGGDNDAVNQPISWSRGTCDQVWCHSNARPLGGGATVYRRPQWAGPQPCTYCHGGAAQFSQMQASDNLSRVHAQHAATNLYAFTCDACHAWTAANDCTVAINGATGYDNHVNGVKTVRFDNNFKGSINMSGATYDNGAYRCYNTYCHSNGTDNAAFNTPARWPLDNTVSWDNVQTATCRSCHGWTVSSGSPIGTLGHDNHVNNAATLVGNYSCYRCHNATVGTDNQTITGYAQHVNGFKNVAFSENAAWAGYVNGTKTCSNTFCHRQGNKNIPSGGDNLSIAWDCTVDTNCRTCHGSKAVQANYTYASKLGEPNYDNGFNSGVANTQNSHYKHMRLPGADNTAFCAKCHPDVSPTVVNALATDNWARHINDNVDVRGGNGASFTWDAPNHRCSSISCHGGGTADWGQKLNCAGCHVSMGIENWTYNTGTHRAHTDNTQYRIACEACHAWKSTLSNVTHGNGLVGGFQYAEVRFSDNGSAQTYSTNPTAYYSDNMFGSWYARTWSPTYAAGGSGGADNLAGSITWSTGSCSNVYCHSNAGPLGSAAGAVVRTQPAWGATYGCNVCHSYRDNNTNMLGNDNNLSKVHAQHVATNWYNFTCYECHGSTVNITDNVAGYDNHVNGARNWKFSATFKGSINQLGGSYSGSPNYQCTNLYCHSTGADNGAFAAPLVTPRWDNAGNTGCAYCHGWTEASGTPITTNAHDNHVKAGPIVKTAYACYRCHNATVGTDNQTITGYALHVNGYKNVAFNSGAGTYAVATKTCANSVCHQQGQPLFVGPTYFDNIAIRWDNTNELVCKRCHGSQGGSGYHTSWWGEPNYDNNVVPGGARNSHQKHVYSTDSTRVCALCHPGVSATVDNTFNANTTHINDNVEVQQGGTATFAWNQGTHTCTNISCHGGSGTTAIWGQTLLCQACHVGTGDRNDYAVNDCAARIDNTQWQSTGHGSTAAFARSGNPAPNDGTRFGAAANPNCTNFCHDTGLSHAADNATVNFFRLSTGQGSSGRTAITPATANDVCKQCHTTGGAFAAQATRDIVTSHYGAKHNTDNNGGFFCWDCHEPHGDNNAYMIHATPANKTDNATGPGKPLRTKATGFDRAGASFAWGDYVKSNYTGLCQVCHNSTVSHFDNTSKYDTNHNPGYRCTSCHGDTYRHDLEFRGLGTCVSCHSGVVGTAPNTRRQVTGTGGDFDNGNAATHHMTNYFDNTTLNPVPVQNVDCSKCHWEGWLATDVGYPGAGNEGKTNPAYHWLDLGTNVTAKYVQLRIWTANVPPTAYTLGTTAEEWRNDDTWNSAVNASNLNDHCLGCHRSTILAATPFSDGRSPRVRAWDGVDIGTKYLQTGTTGLNKYPPQRFVRNTVPVLKKSLSAHYDTRNNERGVATTGAWADDAPGAGNPGTATGTVACFDCHNSHGSPVAGTATLPLTSYSDNASLNAGLTPNNGGLFKTTNANVSGYSTTYAPVANATDNYGAGSDLCFDCHVGSNAAAPKNYTSYGARSWPIAGYYDPVNWRAASFTAGSQGLWNRSLSWNGSFSYKDNTIRSSHFLKSTTNATGTGIAWQSGSVPNALNGRCAECHDPHGVSTNTSQVSNANYGVPLLKGTWLSSPYLEDRPGDKNFSWNTYVNRGSAVWRSYNNWANYRTSSQNVTNGYSQFGPRISSKYDWNRPAILGGGYGTGPGAAGTNDNTGGFGHDGFFIDENTFGLTFGGNANFNMFNANSNNTALNWRNVWVNSGNNAAMNNTAVPATITETNALFAGLCEKCHNATSLRATNSKNTSSGSPASSAHLTVRNYGPMTHDIVLANFFNNATNNGQNTQQAVEARYHDAGGDEQWAEGWPAGSGDSATGIPVSWGLGFGNGTNTNQRSAGYVQGNYHNFPCSKCHTPHTSRLPRLLKTNCLDTGIGGTNAATNLQKHSINANRNINRMRTSVGTSNNNRWTAARAVRCHNQGYYITGTGASDTRWNTVTPW